MQILQRLDHNQDAILEADEIPDACRAFVDRFVQKMVQRKANTLEPIIFKNHLGLKAIDLQVLGQASRQFTDTSSWVATEKKHELSTSEQLKRYASILLVTYDQNRDRVLSADEAQRLGDQWRRWDLNQDGQVDSRELALRIGNLQRNQPSSTSTVATRKSVPSDAPPEFIKRDKNRDGQIQMVEFTDQWTLERVANFRDRDANGDGIIILSEWLKHQLENDQ